MVYIYVVTSAIVIKATVQAVLAALWVINLSCSRWQAQNKFKFNLLSSLGHDL